MCNRSCLAKVDVERGEGCTGYCQTVCRRCLQPCSWDIEGYVLYSLSIFDCVQKVSKCFICVLFIVICHVIVIHFDTCTSGVCCMVLINYLTVGICTTLNRASRRARAYSTHRIGFGVAAGELSRFQRREPVVTKFARPLVYHIRERCWRTIKGPEFFFWRWYWSPYPWAFHSTPTFCSSLLSLWIIISYPQASCLKTFYFQHLPSSFIVQVLQAFLCFSWWI